MRRVSFLRRLLLRFLGLLVLVSVISSVYETVLSRGTNGVPPDMSTKSCVDRVKKMIDTEFSPEKLDGLFGRRDEIHTSDIGGQLFDREPITDSWGCPVAIIKRDSTDVREPPALGVFSRGPDGVTSSNGNDADDISSWATVDNPFWKEVHRRAFIRCWTNRCAWAGALTLVVSILLSRYNRSRNKDSLMSDNET